MPIFEYNCKKCKKNSEILILSEKDKPKCQHCGNKKVTKVLSAHSSLSGSSKNDMQSLKRRLEKKK